MILLFGVVACTTTEENRVGKMLTENIPSDDKNVREGRALDSTKSVTRAEAEDPADFNLIERLYDTVWFQTEEEFDDGKLETETEFVIFDDKSYIVEREMEDGKMEKVEADDFAKLEWKTDVALAGETVDLTTKKTASRNAFVAKNTSIDDGELEMEYEGYWLVDAHNLYIVEGDTQAQAERLLKLVIAKPGAAEFLDTEKYLLSTNIQR